MKSKKTPQYEGEVQRQAEGCQGSTRLQQAARSSPRLALDVPASSPVVSEALKAGDGFA